MLESLATYTLETPHGHVTMDWRNPNRDSAFLVVTSITSGVEVRRSMEPLPRQDGSYVGDAFSDARVITIQGRMPVVAKGGTEAERVARNRLKADTLGKVNSLMRNDGYLRWEPAGLEPLVMRVRRFEQPLIDGGTHKNVLISLVAPDPKAYSATEYSARIAVNLAGLGFTNPVANPVNATIPTDTRINQPIVNRGNAPTHPRVSIQGPITSPLLYNSTMDEGISLPGLTVPAGETLDIDMGQRLAYLNGDPQFTVYSYVDIFNSSFFALEPYTNDVRLSGSSTNEDTMATFFWNSAYTE